ncbi:MAG TPA: hypothetical protein VFR86_25185 [Burkholderiaceae bacterium]|nr:hypothetical protein [Burkholderiaceae bacterium]
MWSESNCRLGVALAGVLLVLAGAHGAVAAVVAGALATAVGWSLLPA